MAKDDADDLVVSIDDADTVLVEGVDDQVVAEPKVEKPAKVAKPRVDPEESTGPTPEQALAEAQAYSKQQEDARRAAEATAANERAMREQAQRQAALAQQEAEQHRERADSSELTVIDNGIAAAQQQLQSFEEEYTRAAESGEFAKMATIQTKLSKAAAALDRLENAKSTFVTTARVATTEGRVEAPVAEQSAFEKYVSSFAPIAQSWIRQHPDCVPASVGGNATKNSMMMAGHYAALAKNIQEGTPEYFKTIEEHIAPTQAAPVAPTVTSKAAEVVPATERKAPLPSAPVVRDATPGSNAPRSVREVRLTKEQQEMAKVSFPHLPEQQAFGQYARNLLELTAEGKLGRLTH